MDMDVIQQIVALTSPTTKEARFLGRWAMGAGRGIGTAAKRVAGFGASTPHIPAAGANPAVAGVAGKFSGKALGRNMGIAGAGAIGTNAVFGHRESADPGGDAFNKWGPSSQKYDEMMKGHPAQAKIDEHMANGEYDKALGLQQQMASGKLDNDTDTWRNWGITKALAPQAYRPGASDYRKVMTGAQTDAMKMYDKGMGQPQKMQEHIGKLQELAMSPTMSPTQRSGIQKQIDSLRGQLGQGDKMQGSGENIRQRMMTAGMADPRMIQSLNQQQQMQQQQHQQGLATQPYPNQPYYPPMPDHWGMNMGGRPGGGQQFNPYLNSHDYKDNMWDQAISTR